MVMLEFLRNVQTARNVALSHQTIQSGSNPPVSVPCYRSLKQAVSLWLSPRVVTGYDPHDFDFLPADQLSALTVAIEGYRKIADAIANHEPTSDEMQQALEHLNVIARLLAGLLDVEGLVILEAICQADGRKPLPDFVLGLDYTLDTDWSGDPGIWIWVIVPDEVDPDSEAFIQFSRTFRKAAWQAVSDAKSNRLPYVYFRLLSEAIGTVVSEEETV